MLQKFSNDKYACLIAGDVKCIAEGCAGYIGASANEVVEHIKKAKDEGHKALLKQVGALYKDKTLKLRSYAQAYEQLLKGSVF